MNMYEKLVETLKSTFGQDPEKTLVSGSKTSSIVSAELVLMASLLIAALTIRIVSPALMIVVVVALMLTFMYATPIMPKLYKEHTDDFNNMMFYAVLTLAIIAMKASIRDVALALAIAAFSAIFLTSIVDFSGMIFPGINYIYQGVGVSIAPNLVTNIVFDFRGFDTLGEAFILVSAVVTTMLVFGRGKVNLGGDDDE